MTFYGSSVVGGGGDRALLAAILKDVGIAGPRKDSGTAIDMAEVAKRDGVVKRKDVAKYFGVDEKTIYRMEGRGVLKRCPGLDGAVRYRARDVLRLASDPRREV